MNKKFFLIALTVALSLTITCAISAEIDEEEGNITIQSGQDWHKRQSYTKEEYDELLEKARKEEQIMMEVQEQSNNNKQKIQKKQRSYWDF